MKNYHKLIKDILIKKQKNGQILLKTSEIEQILEISSEMQDKLGELEEENSGLRNENLQLLNLAIELEDGINE